MNATTAEQSGELLRSGLQPGTADMVRLPLDDGRWVALQRVYCDHDPFIEYDEEDLCWSLDALLGVIPSVDGIDVDLCRVSEGMPVGGRPTEPVFRDSPVLQAGDPVLQEDILSAECVLSVRHTAAAQRI